MNEHQAEALRVARALVEAGMPVFTAEAATYPDGRWRPDGGSGRCGYWLPSEWEKTTPDPAVVDRWRPGMALCAVMGHGLDLLDVDPRHGGDKTKAGLQAAGMWPTVYGHASTPSGGTHDFIAPLGVGSRDSVRDGLDVKGGQTGGESRGFAFIAPTVKLSKTTGEIAEYRWIEAPDLDMLSEESADDDTGAGIADMVAAAKRGTKTRKAGAPDEEKPAGWFMRGPIPAGQRHRTLLAFAGWLRRVNAPRDMAEKMLRQRWAECDQGAEPYTWEEAEFLLGDVYKRHVPTYQDVESLVAPILDDASHNSHNSGQDTPGSDSGISGTENGGGSVWEDPIPVGPPELPLFPVDRLGHLAPWVHAQVAAKNVAPAVAALSALAVISAAIGGRRRVQVKDDWIENVCLYVMALAPSSGRKTPALAAAKDPLVNAVGALKDAQAEDIRLHNERIEIAASRYDRAKQGVIKAGKDAEAELDTARGELSEAGEPRQAPLAIIGGDSTPEYVVKVAAEQGGRVAVLGSESGFLTQLTGAYGTEAIMDFPLEAFTGSAYDSGRVSRGGTHMPSTAMTVGLIIQPAPIEGLSRRNPQIKGNGFVNRLLFAFAESMGPGTFHTPTVPMEVSKAFDTRVADLVERVWGAETTAVMGLTQGATEVIASFYNQVEQRRAPGGDLHDLAEWSGKLCGQVVRLAACLALFSDSGAMEIDAEVMADAVALAPYFEAHARRAMAVMDATAQGGHRPLLDILGWLKANVKPGKTATVRQVWQGLKGRSWASEAETIKTAMSALEELGWVAEIPVERTPGKRGRGPSPKFEFHPWVHSSPATDSDSDGQAQTRTPLEKASQKSQKSLDGSGDPNSGISGTQKRGGSVSGEPLPSPLSPLPVVTEPAPETTVATCRTPGCTIRVTLAEWPNGHCYDHQATAA